MSTYDLSIEAAKKLFESYLERKGRTLDPLRMDVLKAALSFHLHFRPQDISEKISKNIDSAFVEEVIDELVDAGLIRKLVSEDSSPTYEHVIGHLHHDHLVCLKCGRVQEFFEPAIESIQEDITRRYRYLLVRHSHLIYGLCPECACKYADEFAPLITLPPTPKEGVPLSLVPAGKSVKLLAVHGRQGICKRVAEMGINVGDTFEVVQNSFAGQFVIKFKETRLALGQGMVHRMIVQELKGQKQSD